MRAAEDKMREDRGERKRDEDRGERKDIVYPSEGEKREGIGERREMRRQMGEGRGQSTEDRITRRDVR